jgi:hypothetical protein
LGKNETKLSKLARDPPIATRSSNTISQNMSVSTFEVLAKEEKPCI